MKDRNYYSLTKEDLTAKFRCGITMDHITYVIVNSSGDQIEKKHLSLQQACNKRKVLLAAGWKENY